MNVTEYLKSQGYETLDMSVRSQIPVWRAWYRGHVKNFHNYTIHNKGRPISRVRASLNMAKQGAEYWASLLWNDECYVNLDQKDADALVNQVLRDNDFWRQTNQLTEQAWATGTGAYVVYPDNEKIQIDYIGAESIFPLSVRNGEIENCAFAGAFEMEKQQLLYLMVHLRQPDGDYLIQNKFFTASSDGEQLTEMPTPKGVEPEYTTKARRFAIIKPNIANNLTGGPMGIPIYANCIDTLKSIDLAYDGIKTAMEVGRPRMGVTSNMLRVDVKDGEIYEVFDAGDIAVYDMGGGGAAEKVEVKDLTPPYRATAFEQSLQTQLKIYAQCIGLGENSFRWDGDGPKTATEVVSQNSAMLRAMEKHQAGLRSAIVSVAKAILDSAGKPTDVKVTIIFDDSTTRDKAREAQEAWQWVQAGRFPFWEYLVRYQGYDEDEAKKADMTLTSEE